MRLNGLICPILLGGLKVISIMDNSFINRNNFKVAFTLGQNTPRQMVVFLMKITSCNYARSKSIVTEGPDLQRISKKNLWGLISSQY